MTTYSLAYTNIFVSNFHRALKFYSETIGLETVRADEKFGYASFATKGARLAIAEVNDEQANLVGRHTGVGLMVSDLDKAFEALKVKGVSFPMEPQRQPWGGYMALMEDSEGNILYLDQIFEDS
jgi:lactoylglutathione lyase